MLTRVALDLYRKLKANDPAFRDGNSLCDFGAQLVKLGKNHPKNKCTSEYYCRQEYGFRRYVSIDINGEHGALPLDLNVATAKDVGEPFDVVTNHGTTEHCLNQLNCFTLMHDLTKVGGLMIHIVPSWPHNAYDSCFFFMSTEVFDNVAEVNHYDKVRLELVNDSNGKYVLAVLRKTLDLPFVIPIEGYYRPPSRVVA